MLEYEIKGKINLNQLSQLCKMLGVYCEMKTKFYSNRMTYPLYNAIIVHDNYLVFDCPDDWDYEMMHSFYRIVAQIDKEG